MNFRQILTGLLAAALLTANAYGQQSKATPILTGQLPTALRFRTTGVRVVAEGDSLIAPQGVAGCNTSITDATCWDTISQLVLMQSNLKGRVSAKWNFGVPGSTIADTQARYTANVHPLAPLTTNIPTILFTRFGANDFENNETVSQVETALTTYWAAAKADGFTLAASTIMRRGDHPEENAEVVRQTVNTWIRAQFQAGAYDYLMDFDRLYNNPLDATLFNSDTIHPNAAGKYLEAKYVNGILWGDSVALPIVDSPLIGTGQGNYRGTWNALRLLTTGANNTAFGSLAAGKISTGASNTAYGSEALRDETTGSSNACFGRGSCQVLVGGSNNAAFGAGTLAADAATTGNVAVGYQAHGIGTTGNNNVYMGYRAGLNALSTGNVAVGYLAMGVPASTGGNNVAVGFQAMQNAGVAASSTVAIGRNAATNVTGTWNTCIGDSSCPTLVAGTRNVAIGQGADLGAAVTNAVQLGLGTNATSNTLQYLTLTIADSAGKLYTQTTYTPGNSTATCQAGAFWTDGTYLYMCTATNTIKRVALSSF